MNDYRTILEHDLAGVGRAGFTFDDVSRRRDRKRRNQRIRAGVVGLAVFVVAVWVVTTGLPSDRTQTPATSGPAVTGPTETGPAVTEPAFDPSDDFVGLPPEGAEPISLEDGDLIARAHEIHIGWVYLYADGRMISWSEGTFESPEPYGYRQQLLTPEGAELLRAELLSTGLFDHDRWLLDGYGRLDTRHDLDRGFIEVRDGDRWVNVGWGPDADMTTEGAITTSATPKQALTLARFLYLNPTLLPASAWEDPTLRPYVPARYAFCPDPDLSELPVAARDLLRGKEQMFDVAGVGPFDFGGVGQGEVECFEIALEEALALDEILVDTVGSIEPRGPEEVVTGSSGAPFEPILPHETFASQPG